MKKKNRVLKNHEFSKIIGNGNFVKTPSFILYWKPRRQDHSRVGISVGKKMGNAPERNKIKRQVRAMVDSIFHFNEDYDTICIVRPVYRKKTYEENLAQLRSAYPRLGRQRKGMEKE